uniref:Suprabasin n=1 Tax=Ailuropoda melanoleuca TaxID=9646 RepID=A0A7N5JH75_AILME
MHLASLVSSCSLLLLLGALPGWAANDDPIEKVIEGINRRLSDAEREVGKALEGINNGITHAGREVEKVFNGLSHMGSQAGKELDKGVQGLNSGLDKVAHGINNGIGQAGKEAEKFAHGVNNAAGQGAHPGVSTGQHGGGAATTLTSGASVNKPFISFPALWKVSAQEVSTFCCLWR